MRGLTFPTRPAIKSVTDLCVLRLRFRARPDFSRCAFPVHVRVAVGGRRADQFDRWDLCSLIPRTNIYYRHLARGKGLVDIMPSWPGSVMRKCCRFCVHHDPRRALCRSAIGGVEAMESAVRSSVSESSFSFCGMSAAVGGRVTHGIGT